MTIDFTDKNVLITGGSRGIGKACAELFAQTGANVIITYKGDKTAAEEVLQNLKPAEHAAYQLDVTNPAAIDHFFVAFRKNHRTLDVLINNAGVYIEHKILESNYQQWQQNWDDTLKTNLYGPANMMYFASHIMQEQGGGRMINISSRGAFRGEPDHPAYGASKAGLNAMSQSLAVALAPHNISVHIIAPGFVETDMASEILNSPAGEGIKKQSPFGRVAKPEEVARLALIYASPGFEFTSAGIVDVNGASYLRS